MAITRKPVVKAEPVDTISNFINQAPDGIKSETPAEKRESSKVSDSRLQ